MQAIENITQYLDQGYHKSSIKEDFKNAIIEGKGTIKFRDGKIYEGDFKKGKIEGKGQLNYDNGIIFKGEFILS